MKKLIPLLALLCLTTLARAGGNISWETVHDEIKKQDPVLIAMIDKTFDVADYGDAIRPLGGARASERFAPYDFHAKLKGSKGAYVFNLTFDDTNEKSHPWSVLIQQKWK